MGNLFNSLMGGAPQEAEGGMGMPFQLPGFGQPQQMGMALQPPRGLGRALIGGVGLLNQRGYDMFGQGRF